MPQERSTVPAAVAVFPTDIAIRPFASQAGHIVRWSELDRGGHFAALEAPDLLTADIREFFRTLSREAGGPGAMVFVAERIKGRAPSRASGSRPAARGPARRSAPGLTHPP